MNEIKGFEAEIYDAIAQSQQETEQHSRQAEQRMAYLAGFTAGLQHAVRLLIRFRNGYMNSDNILGAETPGEE